MRTRWMAAMVAAGVTLLPHPAEAGGSWLDTDRQHYAVGDRVVARGTFGTGSLQGTVGDGPFHAYLTPGDRAWDDLPTEDAIYLGPMTITEATGRYCCWVARVEFTVPDVPSGRYWIDYCNDPCTVDGIGDLIGGMIIVGETEREARLAARLERAKARVDRMQERLDEAAAEIATLESRTEARSNPATPVSNQAAPTSRSAPEPGPVISITGAALIAGGLLVFSAALVLRHRGSKRPTVADRLIVREAGILLPAAKSPGDSPERSGIESLAPLEPSRASRLPART